jgi:HIRAN domain
MEFEIECREATQQFCVAVVGVTKTNADDSSRQSILSKTKSGEAIDLVREYDNKFDKNAVAVINRKGEQLGYLPTGDRMAIHIDLGGKYSAVVKKITGGPSILDKIFRNIGKNYGCVLQIEKGGINWDLAAPYIAENKNILNLLQAAKDFESSNPILAIQNYKEAITKIKEMDSKGHMAIAWRSARHPVNRLSLLSEMAKDFKSAYETILDYEAMQDECGLLKIDSESVAKRKIRLEKKLQNNL